MKFSVSSGQCPWNGVALVISNCRGVVEPDWSSEIFEHARIEATDASLDLEPGWNDNNICLSILAELFIRSHDGVRSILPTKVMVL